MKGESASSPGEIRADAIYTLEEIDRRLRLGKAAIRRARRQRLIVHRIGRRNYIIGRDFINYLDAQHRAQRQPAE